VLPQLPLAHSVGPEHVWPIASRHAPLPSHAWMPLHAGFTSICPFGIGLHVPIVPARLHDRHAPLHAVSQQKPSAQAPEMHCESAEQPIPFGRRQVPLPEQAYAPVQIAAG
jgi:hypothetical protein